MGLALSGPWRSQRTGRVSPINRFLNATVLDRPLSSNFEDLARFMSGATIPLKWAALVPGLAEYGNTCVSANFVPRDNWSVSSNSDSDSSGKPTMMSVVIATAGNIPLIVSTARRYSEVV